MREQAREGGGIDLAGDGVQVMEDAHAVVGAGGGDIEHPVLGLGRGDDDLIGPGNDLRGGDKSFGEAADVVFGDGAEIRGGFHG